MEYFNELLIIFSNYPYIAIFLGFCLILFLIPIPEEVLLFTGGYLSYKYGGLMWVPTLIAGILGVFITDYWYFLWFKLFGTKLMKTRIGRMMLSEESYQKYSSKVKKYGAWMVVGVRFIPGGIRNPTFSLCGLSDMSHWKFIAASLGTACFTSQVTFWLGYFFGSRISSIETLVAGVESRMRIVIISVAVIIISIILIKKFYKKRASAKV